MFSSWVTSATRYPPSEPTTRGEPLPWPHVHQAWLTVFDQRRKLHEQSQILDWVSSSRAKELSGQLWAWNSWCIGPFDRVSS